MTRKGHIGGIFWREAGQETASLRLTIWAGIFHLCRAQSRGSNTKLSSRAGSKTDSPAYNRLRKNAGPGVAPDFSPSKRVVKPAYALGSKIRALALVRTSEAVCDFFRSLFSPDSASDRFRGLKARSPGLKSGAGAPPPSHRRPNGK